MTTNHSNHPTSDIRDATRDRDLLATRADALGDGATDGYDDLDETLLPLYDGDQLEREERAALRRVQGLSTELEDVLQRRQKPDPATWLGKGKALELRDIVAEEGADTVICDGELAPSQRRALEDVVKVKVIDRTALILDIFAQH